MGLQVGPGTKDLGRRVNRNHVVICRADNPDEWEYVAATRRLFTAEEAARYAASVSVERYPRVLTAAEYLAILGWKEARE